MSRNPALEAAIALSRTPALVGAMRRQSLPAGVPLLLQIVAGDPADAAEESALACKIDRLALEQAVELYIQQVMLFPNAPPHRVLGVGLADSRADMRRHMRWLMMWLHPDHNASEWRSAYAARVLAAWREVSDGGPIQTNQASKPAGRGAGRQARARGGARRRPGQVLLPWVASPFPRQSASAKSVRALYALSILALLFLGLWMASPSDFPQSYLALLMGDDAPAAEMLAQPGASPPEADLVRAPAK